MQVRTVTKRDGRVVLYDESKIANAILKALQASGMEDAVTAARLANMVGGILAKKGGENYSIEDIQDEVERTLMHAGFEDVAKRYILYRANRTRVRESNTALMQACDEITNADARQSDLKRDNANVDGNTAMGSMLQLGAAAAKSYNSAYLLTPAQAKAYEEGWIHIHDFDFYALTTTCCQIDVDKLFTGGFNTGHGFLREPQDIQSYASLACIAIQSNQNDQHGGQGIPNFDYALAKGVKKTYRRLFADNLYKALKLLAPGLSIRGAAAAPGEAAGSVGGAAATDRQAAVAKAAGAYDAATVADAHGNTGAGSFGLMGESPSDAEAARIDGEKKRVLTLFDQVAEALDASISLGENADFVAELGNRLKAMARAQGAPEAGIDTALAFALGETGPEIERRTYQAMEAVVHNLNSMHSRAGAQTPFSSINYGTDTSPEGRMIIKNILLVTEAGLGHGETSIFPIQIFKLKSGVNYDPEDPNYDMFELACRVSAKRLFPNFVNLDAPYNLKYYVPGRPETEVATMGCRTRVIANRHDPGRETTFGRGNLSFTSINLPRIAIEARGDEAAFFRKLDEIMELAAGQLLDRFEIQARKHVRNFPFLMGEGIWMDAEKLGPGDEIREVLKHGTLSLGFIGLAEALVALYGHHHGESADAQQKGLDIISHMNDFATKKGQETGMNFSLLATPAEGLSGRFIRMDKKRYGSIPGVTDREYYTNSFHVPVYYPISAFEKIRIEAPYHALTPAGHITYVEMDGDPSKNLEAFMDVVRCMHDMGVGYGSVNHPVDRDPVCGYVGVIGDVCPRCGRRDGEPIDPDRLPELVRLYPEIRRYMERGGGHTGDGAYIMQDSAIGCDC
ncbi:MAG: anaerobic ribonucleoside-triphosphate reductase [Lachnospiraceae bacterium]|nr:anaerobic ribonucleoside-triphosphate reductase [Lachnospiraceae bacterium]